MSQEKFTNIVGVPIKKYVKEQLYTRSFQGSTVDSRNNDQILYLANKNCWIRLVSFVNVEDDQLRNNLDIQGKGRGGDPVDVSKQWMLFGGTSYYENNNNNLRFGLETNDPSTITNKSAYGLGGVDQFGYRPMPGIISATIEHAGTAGSLRIANIKFKVWNINQLNAIDALYFRLGYSCLLEWGHTSYLDNNNKLVTIGAEINPLDVFNNNIYKTKENIIRGIIDKRKKSYGNYDGLYGLISNYEWSQDTDGSYDCSIKLTGLGSVIDSLKINQAFSMPGDETKSPNQSSDNSITQTKQQPPAKIQPTKPYVIESSNRIAWPEIGEYVAGNGSDIVYINFEKLEKRKKDLEEQINKGNLDKNKGINILYIYAADSNGRLIEAEKYKKFNPNVKKRIFDKGAINYKKLVEISKTEVASPFVVPFVKYNTSDDEELKKLTWKIQLINNNTVVKLSKVVEINITDQNTDEYTVELKTGETQFESAAGIGFQEDVTTERILSHILIEIDFRLNSQEDFEILRPIPKDIPNYAEIKSPALRRYYNIYSNFYNTSFKNKQDNNKQQSGRDYIINSKIINVSFGNLSVIQVKDNIIEIEAQITTKDIINTKTTASEFNKGDRIQAVQQALADLYNSFSYFNAGDLRNFTTVTQYNNESIFNGDVYEKSNTTQKLKIATIEYNYDEEKISNTGNTNTNILTEAITTVESTIPETYFSNIDKFLIELRDYASSVATTNGGKINGMYEYITNQLKNGSLDSIRTTYENKQLPETPEEVSKLNTEEQLAAFILKGFNSEFLSGETNAGNKIKNVDFKELFNVYNSKISDNGNQGKTSKFYYIKLGLLLYYLNNNSIFYEKTKDGKIKKPFIYIDFNPETNYCFTTPYHLSVDPGVCMIKINLNNDAYRQLFPSGLAPADPFNSDLDRYSDYVDSGFASVDDVLASRGKLMNIPVNIDHIINILKAQSNNNPKTDVLLRSFLETLMDDINKSLGNINNFRVGYYDDGNTVRIYDDQVINPPSNQSVISNNSDSALLPIEPTIVPIIGKNSIVRSLTLKSEVSTKMSQMIAFSSQAGNLGAQNTDSSGLGDTNVRLTDRMLPEKVTVSGNSASTSNQQTNIESTEKADKDAAKIFDTSIKNIYLNGIYTKKETDTLKVYYSTATNKLKAEKDGTKARQVLPISINITTDGISGLTLLEGFTVPKDVLPMQYLNTKGENRVGFAIAGLNHTIDNNQWVTAIRGQMINIPSITRLNAKDFGIINTSAGGGKGADGSFNNYVTADTSFIGTNNEAKKAAEQYLGKSISSIEWSQLVSATFAEASGNQTERAYVMAAILNRTRSKSWGSTITSVLTAKNQFQAVTGTKADPGPSIRYANGPSVKEAENIYGATINLLSKVPKNIINFTAANIESYGPGTRPKYREELFARGGFIIGKTIFSS